MDRNSPWVWISVCREGEMKSIFFRTLLAFLLSLLIFTGISLIGLFWGFHRSTKQWSTDKRVDVEDFVRSTLLNVTGNTPLTFREDVPIFIYNPSKELVYSNRGGGRRRQSTLGTDLNEIVENGTIIGYYYAGALQFQSDSANIGFWGIPLTGVPLHIVFGSSSARDIPHNFFVGHSLSLHRIL